ncbi:MAG: hypothetical protein AB2A00_20475 [Myxococcota bacterium]
MRCREIMLSALLVTTGCTTVHRTPMKANEVAGAQGEVVAVVDVTSTGLGLGFNKVMLVPGGTLDTAVNKTLMAEAKAAGGSRVQVVSLVASSHAGMNVFQFPWVVTLPTVVVTAYVLK